MLHLLFSVRSAYLPINNPKPPPRNSPYLVLPLEAFAIFNFAVLKMMVSRGAFAILNLCIVWNYGFA